MSDANSFISGFQAASPLIMVGAAFNPSLTRKLMGLHLLGDALTGVINFRTPGVLSGLTLEQTIAPYATMLGFAVASEASKGLE